MLIKTIFSGFGGQGVLSMGQIIAKSAMYEGRFVTYLPSYGAEVRGGTANCTVTISDEEIASPIASDPEFVIALNQPSFFRFQNLLQSGGFMLFNSSLVDSTVVRGDIEVFGVPTAEIAAKQGNIKVANMVLLGAFINISNLISIQNLITNLPDIIGAGRSHLLKANENALNAGFEYARENYHANKTNIR